MFLFKVWVHVPVVTILADNIEDANVLLVVPKCYHSDVQSVV